MRLPLRPLQVFAAMLLALGMRGFSIEREETIAGRALGPAQLEAFAATGVPDEQWPPLLEMLSNPDEAQAVRGLVRGLKPFPAKALVAQLSSRALAARLGALDFLEEAAGDSFGFDPWQDDPAAGGNAQAIVRWREWAEKGGAPDAGKLTVLNDETFRSAATEVMSGDAARMERAMQRLEAYGLGAVAKIEDFLSRTDLETAPRARLKAAEYRLVLAQTMPRQAAALARDLALGTPEAQSTAAAALGRASATVLPILGDLLSAPDPLVRETVVDAAFSAAKEHALPVVLARLEAETAENVLHVMLRGIAKHASASPHAEAVAKYLTHPSENVVITALEALETTTQGALSDALGACLADPRWRVRASALATIGKRRDMSLVTKITPLLEDRDSFVRVSAVTALTDLQSVPQPGSDANGGGEMIPYFLKHDDLKPVILKSYLSGKQAPPPEIADGLWKADAEVILQCIDLFDERGESFGRDEARDAWKVEFVARFAGHPRSDVAASALRILATGGRRLDLLLNAMNGADSVKLDAVLDQLVLPSDLLQKGTTPVVKVADTTRIGSLYAAFEKLAPATNDGAGAARISVEPAAMRAVLEKYLSDGSPRQKFSAACVLLAQSDEPAGRYIASVFDTLSALDCRRVAASLRGAAPWSADVFMDLARRVLRHAASDVRETAISTWLTFGGVDRIGDLLGEISRPDSLLHPADVYQWELSRLYSKPGVAEPIRAWAKQVLEGATSPSLRVFAMVLLEDTKQAQGEWIERQLNDADPWVRRAALHTLGRAAVVKHIDTVMKDRHAGVRVVIPFLATPNASGWDHQFDDNHSASALAESGSPFSYGNSSGTFGAWTGKGGGGANAADDAMLADVLDRLSRDVSERVRFEAQFALLRLGSPVEPKALAALLAAQGSESDAARRVKSWMGDNYSRLGKGYAVLIPLLEIEGSYGGDEAMLTYFGVTGKESPFASFSAIAKLAESPDKGADNAVSAAPPSPPPVSDPAAPLRVLYFYKPGCRDCERVHEMLGRYAALMPGLLIEERNIETRESVLLNEAVSARMKVRDVLHQVAPAVFTQAGALVRDEINFARLGDLLRAAAKLPRDDSWARVETPELAVAATVITERGKSLRIAGVLGAGLLDGVNPCAFATIIFLLSYLQIARRTPREILAVGAAFISAVFLAYFAVGLGLVRLLEGLSGLGAVRGVLNYGLAGLALVIAFFSFRDARLAAAGRLGEITLQLPGFLKERIRTVVRTGAKARNFVLAAFLAGIAISLLELACTGQMYLPTIQFMLQGGERGALGLLLLYNTAFVVPLILIFLLAWGGMRSDALIAFQRRHTAMVKVLTGVVFVGLAAFLVFGNAWLASLK